MFIHNLKYAMKTLFKNKTLLFWTFAFPIILGTLFHMAFRDIEKSEQLDIIDIAIVDNQTWQENTNLQNVFKTLGSEEKGLFDITYTSLSKAQELLEQNTISGYLILSDTLKVVIKENGINQTILKYVIEEILQTEEIMNTMISNQTNTLEEENQFYATLYQKIMELKEQNGITVENIASTNLSYTMIEFYTLIAMTCLYGGILGLYVINQNLANQSHNGKRIAMSPTSKGKVIISSALAGYMVQLIGIALLFCYTIFVLHIDYGNDFLKILLLTLIGCFAGLSMGIMIASVLKSNENTKTGIVIAVTMLGCFLSGMMGITMKYIIDKNIPILNVINPASMITDGFYSLYYYETLTRYYFNLMSLVIFSILMICLSIKSLRRQKYDSI